MIENVEMIQNLRQIVSELGIYNSIFEPNFIAKSQEMFTEDSFQKFNEFSKS